MHGQTKGDLRVGILVPSRGVRITMEHGHCALLAHLRWPTCGRTRTTLGEPTETKRTRHLTPSPPAFLTLRFPDCFIFLKSPLAAAPRCLQPLVARPAPRPPPPDATECPSETPPPLSRAVGSTLATDFHSLLCMLLLLAPLCVYC